MNVSGTSSQRSRPPPSHRAPYSLLKGMRGGGSGALFVRTFCFCLHDQTGELQQLFLSPVYKLWRAACRELKVDPPPTSLVLIELKSRRRPLQCFLNSFHFTSRMSNRLEVFLLSFCFSSKVSTPYLMCMRYATVCWELYNGRAFLSFVMSGHLFRVLQDLRSVQIEKLLFSLFFYF